jgi:serine/threonine protein kinase
VLLNKGHGKGVDWWTLGILIFESLAGQPPFVDDDPMGIYQQILAGKLNFPRYFDRNAKNLIKKLLIADLTKRYGCLKKGPADVKNHKWFSAINYEEMFQKKPTSPIIPTVSGASDTTNFDPYPESVEAPPAPVYSGADPFGDF